VKKNHTHTKSRQGGSNPRSTAYEAVALPLGHTGEYEWEKKATEGKKNKSEKKKG
jgi:hypothetical protein